MYYLYILQCSNNSFYTGITNNIEKRMQAHKDGIGSKYVRAFSPFKLIYVEEHVDRSSACKKEYEIKRLTRKDKIKYLA